MEPTVTRLVQDPLAVLHLNNQLYMALMSSCVHYQIEKREDFQKGKKGIHYPAKREKVENETIRQNPYLHSDSNFDKSKK